MPASRAGAGSLALAALLLLSGPAAGAPPRIEVTRDAAGRLAVRAAGAPLAEVLERVAAAAGVRIEPLSPAFGREPVSVDAGPAEVDRLVRNLVRPHGVAAVYGSGGGGARRVTLVIVPAGGRVGPTAAPQPAPADARADGAWWRLDDLGPGAEPARREAGIVALGGSLDDPGAVALLSAVADGGAGLAAADPARRLARRVLAVRAGADEEDAEEPGEAR